jgi:hypothetical protein
MKINSVIHKNGGFQGGVRKIVYAGVIVVIFSFLNERVSAQGMAEQPLVSVAGESFPSLGFNFLAGYKYEIVDVGTGASAAEIEAAMKRDQVPPEVRAYDGRKVLLTGYLLPLQIEKGLSRKFILMKDVNTCCYGATPSMNDYVIVTMKGAGVKIVQDEPTQLTGTLRIEQKYENGYVVGLYALEGDVFLGVKK